MSIILWGLVILIIIWVVKNALKKDAGPEKEKKRYKNIRKKLFSIENFSNNYVILDTETTGVNKKSEIIEIAIISLAGDILINQRIMPKCPIPIDATGIHGITKRMLKGCPTWADIHDEVANIINGKTIIAYNSKFDVRLLKQTGDVWGCQIKPPKHLCAMLIYAEFSGEWNDYRGNYKWHKLTKAARYFKLDRKNAHSALADCQMTRKLLLKVIDAVTA